MGREHQRPPGATWGQPERTGHGAEGRIGDLSQGVSPRASESPEGTEKTGDSWAPPARRGRGAGGLSGSDGQVGHSRPRTMRRCKECNTCTSGHKTPHTGKLPTQHGNQIRRKSDIPGPSSQDRRQRPELECTEHAVTPEAAQGRPDGDLTARSRPAQGLSPPGASPLWATGTDFLRLPAALGPLRAALGTFPPTHSTPAPRAPPE